MNKEDKKENKTSGWKPAIVTLIIGAIVTIGATYYTIYVGKQQTIQAEEERYRKVKDNIVSIVEEYAVNKKELSINSLQRIINSQLKSENLNSNLSLSEVINQAEYNILNSRHLDIQKKEEYENFLSENFKLEQLDSTYNFNEFKEAELLERIAKEINRGNDKEALNLLFTVIKKYEDTIDKNEVNLGEKDESIFKYIVEKPTIIITALSVYILLSVTFLNFYMKKIKTRREMIVKMKIINNEIEVLSKELDYLMNEYYQTEDEETKVKLQENIKRIQRELLKLQRTQTTANNG